MKKVLLSSIFLLLAYCIFGQKVGLVLSGGGAKGLSHIGVIKALEENNIPIDYITGTSMGALIGGMYAIGMSPNEMIEMVTSPKFLLWSTGQIEDDYLYLYKNLDPNASMLSFKFSLKDSIAMPKLPTNLIPTHQMDLALLQYFAGPTAKARGNFDSLFVPFRCIASDVYNSKQYIARKGDVGSAIRASMTFPFYFKAISIDSVLLFDGGIYNNFPWDVALKEFKPDILIGSNCANNPDKPDEEDLLKQIETMIVSKTNYQIPRNLGFTVENSYPNVSLLDFSKADQVINAAYLNTLSKIDSIKSLINRRIDTSVLADRRRKYVKNIPSVVFDRISVGGLNSKQERYVLRLFQSEKRESFTFNKFKEEYFKLISDNTITSIYPLAIYSDSSEKFTLKFNMKANNDLDINIGGNISSSSMNQGFLGLTYKLFGKKYTRFFSNLYFGKFYSSFLLGGRQDFAYRKPFFYDLTFAFQRFDFYNSSPIQIIEEDKPKYVIQYEYFGKLAYGFPLNSSSFLKFQYNYGKNIDRFYQEVNFTKSDIPDKSKFVFHKLSFSFEKNTLNYYLYPYRGRKQYVGVSYIYGNEYYIPGNTDIVTKSTQKEHSWIGARLYNQSYHKLFNSLWTGFLFDGVFTSKGNFVNYTSTLLSAPAFAPNQQSQTLYLPNYRSNSYIAVGFMPNVIFSPRIYFRAEAYMFLPLRRISTDNQINIKLGNVFDSKSFMYSGSLVYQTVIGPLSISVNYYDKENTKLYFVANFGFVLFNRRSIEY